MELKKYKLGEIIDCFIPGDWGEDAPTAEAQNGVYCIRGADIVPISHSNYNNLPKRYIGSRSMATRLLQAGDLIVEKSGGSPIQSTGRIVYVSKDIIEAKGNVVCSNFCTAFRVKPEWNPLYVYYFWHNVYNSGAFFNFEGKTSGLKNLQLDNALASIEIEYIHLEQQNEIVSVLSSIEKKIALNRQINDNLEAMAKQLYDYWFVQFDFPNEEGKPYKSNGGAMVWNEKLKREIPEGWKVCVLGDYIGRITNGLNPRKNFVLGNGNNYYVTIRSLVGTTIDWNNCDRCDDAALSKINSRSQLQIGDVIFSAIGTIGRTYYILDEPTNWNISETSFTLRARENVPNDFFYGMLRSDEIQIKADKAAMGSTLRCLVMNSLCSIQYVCIPNNLMQSFSAKVSPLYKQIHRNNNEIAELTKQRDELLPLLMNGQASVTLA
jgi:type I restriction enzyme, S subunit